MSVELSPQELLLEARLRLAAERAMQLNDGFESPGIQRLKALSDALKAVGLNPNRRHQRRLQAILASKHDVFQVRNNGGRCLRKEGAYHRGQSENMKRRHVLFGHPRWKTAPKPSATEGDQVMSVPDRHQRAPVQAAEELST
jgi:hypothetical protein